ncbi:unnamed protein product [Danaus chrysippus]|uniref:(African queen) hypothetical protein n=1 Tax=Danaus chrysippus TaxID=151541 RepID=A0A8J2W512_9NEOP|nr:unnamed protein product [Danaus chrysippus]
MQRAARYCRLSKKGGNTTNSTRPAAHSTQANTREHTESGCAELFEIKVDAGPELRPVTIHTQLSEDDNRHYNRYGTDNMQHPRLRRCYLVRVIHLASNISAARERSLEPSIHNSVDDRPLCLFYFTHPFGVLSPEPPTVTVAPPHVARTFVDMQPAPPYWSASSSPGYDTSVTSTRPSYDLGDATVHRNPINVVRNYGLDYRRQSVSSSFFSSDIWFSSSASSRIQEERRVIPYNRILPPLTLPSPRDLGLDLGSSDDVWPTRRLHPGKFSLPPIEMPASSLTCADDLFGEKVSVSESESVKRHKRVFGVKKNKRRARLGSVRRMISCLMKRTVAG